MPLKLTAIFAVFFWNFSFAQEKWDLQKCVVYALEHNISVKQADVQARVSALQLKLSQAGRYPLADFSTSGGYNFGRSVNPATNIFQNNTIFFTNFQLQTSVNIFNWFSQRYLIQANELDKKASEALVDKAKNDVALNVAVAYLQALLGNEQVEIADVQVKQSLSQLENIRKLVKAGSLPELNAVEVEAQLARDSATFIGAQATFHQNLILLKALLAMDMETPFDIEKPDISQIPMESLADLQPAVVYQEALSNQPQQKVNQLRYEAALKNIRSARASMFPTLSAFGNIGSRYSSSFPDQEKFVTVPTGKFDTLGTVEISPGNISYAVTPAYFFIAPNMPFGRQLFNINLSQAVGLNLSVPILNGRRLRTNWERAKLDAENYKLQASQDNLVLQQDIYTAYANALNAQQRFVSANKAAEVSEKAYVYSQKRYAAGLLQTIELITNGNNLFRSRLDALAAQYEYVFRIKLLEFYRGRGLKLR
jgi:outer membrane protein